MNPPSRTPAGDALSALVVLVFQLNGHLLKAGDELAAPTGQTSARWQVLAAAESGTATVAQIARMLSLARQSVQRVADLLEENGLAEYRTNPAHARADILALTPAGTEVLRTIQASQRVWADALGGAIGEAELKRAAQVCARLLELLRTSA
jgi:DNA-binding MarR family transcriptional regulator